MTCARDLEQANTFDYVASTVYQHHAHLGELYTASSFEAVAFGPKELLRHNRGGMMRRYPAYALAEELSVYYHI